MESEVLADCTVKIGWEEDALNRSKQSYRTAHESLGKSLEGKSTEMIMEAVASGDPRWGQVVLVYYIYVLFSADF